MKAEKTARGTVTCVNTLASLRRSDPTLAVLATGTSLLSVLLFSCVNG